MRNFSGQQSAREINDQLTQIVKETNEKLNETAKRANLKLKETAKDAFVEIAKSSNQAQDSINKAAKNKVKLEVEKKQSEKNKSEKNRDLSEPGTSHSPNLGARSVIDENPRGIINPRLCAPKDGVFETFIVIVDLYRRSTHDRYT